MESPRAEAYLLHAQVAAELGSATRAMTKSATLRDGEPTALIPAIRQAMRDVGPYLPLRDPDDAARDGDGAGAAAADDDVGLAGRARTGARATAYSTASVLVSERAEIGILVALGAERTSILRLVASEGARCSGDRPRTARRCVAPDAPAGRLALWRGSARPIIAVQVVVFAVLGVPTAPAPSAGASRHGGGSSRYA